MKLYLSQIKKFLESRRLTMLGGHEKSFEHYTNNHAKFTCKNCSTKYVRGCVEADLLNLKFMFKEDVFPLHFTTDWQNFLMQQDVNYAYEILKVSNKNINSSKAFLKILKDNNIGTANQKIMEEVESEIKKYQNYLNNAQNFINENSLNK